MRLESPVAEYRSLSVSVFTIESPLVLFRLLCISIVMIELRIDLLE